MRSQIQLVRRWPEPFQSRHSLLDKSAPKSRVLLRVVEVEKWSKSPAFAPSAIAAVVASLTAAVGDDKLVALGFENQVFPIGPIAIIGPHTFDIGINGLICIGVISCDRRISESQILQ